MKKTLFSVFPDLEIINPIVSLVNLLIFKDGIEHQQALSLRLSPSRTKGSQ